MPRHGMSDVSIRPAEAGDAGTLARLLAELGYPCDAAAIPIRLDALAAQGSVALVATDAAGQGVGLVCMSAHQTLHASRPVALIMALVVSSPARDRGCTKLSVTSAEHRDGAHAFYPRVGMPYTGRRFAKSLDDDA